MQKQKNNRADFWDAAHDATRTVLFPFGTVIDWLLGIILIALPDTVDHMIGYGQVLSLGSYRIIGILFLAAAVWHTWLLARKSFSPGVLALSSVLLAATSSITAYFAATNGTLLRPAFLAAAWVLVAYTLLLAAWYALLGWTSSATAAVEEPHLPIAEVSSAPASPGASLCVAMLTAPSERAEVIARRLVDERLAACSQVPGEMTSFFWWENQVNRERERIIFLKTRTDLLPAIQSVLKEIHPYKLPELILLPIIGGLPDYLTWVQAELQPPAHQTEPSLDQQAGTLSFEPPAEPPETAQ